MSNRPRWANRTTVAAIGLAVVVALFRLWRLQDQGGSGGLVGGVVAIVVVGGGLSLWVLWSWRRSGERLAAAARGQGLMAGAVWYSAATTLQAPGGRGLLVLRRSGLDWLPADLDPQGRRELALAGLQVSVQDHQVTVTSSGGTTQRFTAHSTKGLLVALGTLGIPVG